jgi:hypothetical protein
MESNKNKKNDGFATILILIILSALTLSIVLAFFEIGYQASKSGLEAELGAQARAYANSCAERALYYFSQGLDPAEILNSYDSYEFGSSQDRCEIVNIEDNIIDVNNAYYLVQARGVVNDDEVIRRIEVFLKTTNGGLSYQYKWTEVQEFNTLSDYAL